MTSSLMTERLSSVLSAVSHGPHYNRNAARALLGTLEG